MTPLHGKAALTKFLEVSNFGQRIWVKASWDLPIPPPKWWKLRANESGESIPVNYVFQLNGNLLTRFRWSGKEPDGTTIWKTESTSEGGFDYLHNLSNSGATIYFYPNQPSEGISNKHVQETNLLFYEIDHRNLDEQWKTVNKFAQSGLPPTAVVFTGGKSLHVYFRLSKAIKVDDWVRLNRKLTIIQDGDPAICNAARAMRLPGMVRRKVVDGKLIEPTSVSLVECNPTTYSPEDFEEILDESKLFPHGLSDDRWRKWRKAALKVRSGEDANAIEILLKSEAELNPKPFHTASTARATTIDPSLEFPLEICLTRDDRELIANGVPQGSRDDMGYKLAANIRATVNKLTELKYQFTDTSEDLFHQYCDRCNPPIPTLDRDRIWSQAKSASKAALDDAYLENCIKAWQSKNKNTTGLPKPSEKKESFPRGVKRQIERNIQKFVDKILEPKPEKRGFEETEPDPVEYAAYLQQEQEQLEAELAESRERQKQKKQDYPARAKDAWRKARRFTADIQKATKWFEADLPPENSIFFGRAGLGRGKTTQLRKWVKQWKAQGKGFICLGYRNTLLLQLCSNKKDKNGEPKGLGFYHLHESDASVMLRDPSSGIALCVDSLWRFKPEDFDGKVVILDEIMSIIRHLLHSDTVKGRDNILELFRQAILRASQVVCLDGCLADWAAKYLNDLAPDKKIIRLDNTYRSGKAHINFLLGTIDIDEEVKANDRSPWLHHLLNDSRVPVICSDSQVFAESLDILLSERGLKVLRIDSKTVPEKYIKECLEDCDAYIEQYQPDVVIYTPSAESGVDVSIKGYFTHHYGFFFGVLGVDAILQMLGRIRDSECTKFVWVKEWVAQSERSHSRSPFIQSVGKAIEQVLVQDITDTLTGIDKDQDLIAKLREIIQKSENSHFKASNQIQAISNYEKGNLRECVLEALREAGYTVACCTLNPNEDSKILVKKATEATKRQNSHEIFTAEKIDADYAEDLSRSTDCKWEDRIKVINALYRKRLPGIDATDSWTEDFIYKVRYENPDFISQQEIFWLFKHPDESKRMNLEKYHRMAQRECTFIGNIRSRAAKVKALRDIGIEYFITPNNAWQEDSPELVELVKRCKDEKIAVALGRHPGQQNNIRFLGGLLKILGLKHTGQKVRSEDGDYRIYQLDLDTLNDPDRLNALQCLDTRWANYLTKEVEILNWDSVLDSQETTTIENTTCQQEGGHSQQAKQPQTLTQQASDPVPGTPSEYIYNIESFVEQDKSHDVVVNEVAQLPLLTPVDALKFALETCQSISQFVALTEGYSLDQVEDAIALSDSQPRRRELTEWWEISQDCRVLRSVSSWGEIQLSQDCLNSAWEALDQEERDRLHNLYLKSTEKPVEVCEVELEETSNEPATPTAFVVGQQLRALRYTFAGKIAKVTETFGDWCESTLGAISLQEVASGCWAFV